MLKKILAFTFAAALLPPFGAGEAAGNPFADVPAGHWAYAALVELDKAGALHQSQPYDGTRIITRYELAQMVGAAMAHREGSKDEGQTVILSKLTSEFAEELDNLGVRIGELEQKQDNLRFNGQIRWHYAENHRSEHSIKDRHELRSRLYLTGKVNDEWNYYAMFENIQNLRSNAEENKTGFERAYVMGPVGEAELTAGAFGLMLAEGNIYDSGIDAVRLRFGDVVKYSLLYGRADVVRENKLYVATASYKDYDYDVALGWHRVDYDEGVPGDNTIWTAGGNYDFGNYSLGAIYLNASERDAKGDRDGYVLTLKHGRVKGWRPHTYELYARLYDQPQHTYLAHGMNGLAGYMEGFKGYSLGAQYALRENIVLGIEYYELRDKITDERNRTIWTQVNFDFRND